MRILSVTLPSSYTKYETTRTTGYSDMGTWKTTAGRLTESRPDRDKSRKPTGWLYPKPYLLYRDSTQVSANCRCEIGWTGKYISNGKILTYPGRTLYTGNFGESVLNDGRNSQLLDSSPNQRKKAEIKALMVLKEDRINLGNAFAEHRQTAKFVGDTFTAIANSIVNAKRGNWKKSFRELRRVSKKSYKRAVSTRNTGITNKWLAWQYAVKPLMQDVDGACKALGDLHNLASWVTTAKGINIHREKESRPVGIGQFNSCDVVTEQFRGYFVRLDFHPKNDFFQLLNSYGVINPLVPLWEITPWSFVIDWAIPVGEWFEALDATFGWDFLSGSCTELRKTEAMATHNWGPITDSGGGQFLISRSIRGKRRTFELKRTVYSKPPIPVLPRFNNPLSATHVANGLSLLVALMRGQKPPSYIRR